MSPPEEQARSRRSGRGSVLEVLIAATRLGLTSFGGPVAHLGYFRDEYVVRRKWVDESTYADLVALCQFLPGPASSQVGIALGILRAGLLGGLAAWLGFTLPSALALTAFAFGVHEFGSADAPWLHGLKLVAVAVVAQAVWGMARTLAPDRDRATIAILVAVVMLVRPVPAAQVALIAISGIIGWRLFRQPIATSDALLPRSVTRRTGILAWITLGVLLVALPLLRQVYPANWLALVDSFFRVGSLVFGGGHVVLPMLQAEVVPAGWVSNDEFVAGYGAAQAVPGPLFTFSAYLGAVRATPPNGIMGATIALVAMFLPAFLLVIGALPFWDALRRREDFQAALRGINAAVVGFLLAALYQPVWTSSVSTAIDVVLVLIAFCLLVLWKLPPWLVVALSALGGALISFFG